MHARCHAYCGCDESAADHSKRKRFFLRNEARSDNDIVIGCLLENARNEAWVMLPVRIELQNEVVAVFVCELDARLECPRQADIHGKADVIEALFAANSLGAIP